MPTITAETPREDYTISGEVFKVAQPYGEGHVLTAAEARALNQTFTENVRNSNAKKIKEAKDAGAFDLATFQGNIDEFISTYEFGKRARGGGGGRSADPIGTRALELAREAVRKRIKEVGGSLKDYPAADISARAKKAVDSNPRFRQLAEKQVKEEASLPDVGELDSPQSQVSEERASRKTA